MTGGRPVTLLVADIEGSTRRWERLPRAMGLALERHDAVRAGSGPRAVGSAPCAGCCRLLLFRRSEGRRLAPPSGRCPGHGRRKCGPAAAASPSSVLPDVAYQAVQPPSTKRVWPVT